MASLNVKACQPQPQPQPGTPPPATKDQLGRKNRPSVLVGQRKDRARRNFIENLGQELCADSKDAIECALQLELMAQNGHFGINAPTRSSMMSEKSKDAESLVVSRITDVMFLPQVARRAVPRGIKDLKMLNSLGSGSFGTVRTCRRRNDPNGLLLAVKVQNIEENESLIRRELRFLDMPAIRDHPHIITLYTAFTTKRNHYMVTNLCYGGDLRRLVRKWGALPEHTVKTITRQVAGALNCLHGMGILHLDVKLANILLKYDWCPHSKRIPLIAQVADFGLSKKCPPGERLEKHDSGTTVNNPLETLCDGIASEKSDVYSLGVAVYEMLCGHHPFKHLMHLKHKELKRTLAKGIPIEFNSPAWQHVSQEAQDFVRMMIRPDRMARPTMVEVLDDSWLSA